MIRLKHLALSLVFIVTSLPANAIDPPTRKPRPTYTSSVLNRSDAERVQIGLEAARDGDWNKVVSYRKALNDPAAKKLLLWRHASTGMNSEDFEFLDKTLTELAGWPGMSSVRENAEEKIVNTRMNASQRAAWLEKSGPISGEGKINLAEAYLQLGRKDDAHRLIRDAWLNHVFQTSRQSQIANEYRNVLTREDHEKRADLLLWLRQRTAAKAMKPYLSSDYDKLVDARIALAVGARGVDSTINAVPARLQSDPGLLFERAYWRRKRGMWDGARPLLLEINPAGVPEAGLARIWDEKNLHIRTAIKQDEHLIAYRLAASHGLTSGVDFASGEFIAGWMALRYLNRPSDALKHFRTLEAGVGSPISKSRGFYWTGEAYKALGQQAEALAAYQQAAAFNTTFYGQRAAEKLGTAAIMSLPAPIVPTTEQRTAFRQREKVKALIMLVEAGEDYQFRRLAFDLDDELTSTLDYALLFDLTKSYNMTQVGVRGAKAGMAKDLVETGAAYPLFPFTLPIDRASSAEPAMVIALSRQESELNPKAVSHAAAYGLMQMLNGTARLQARREGVSYKRSWLLDDPEYNVKLGRAHLSDLIERFDGSYILAIAAYNAGASRPTQWVKDYGDPRRGEIDPIDFIESIPFSETRNYVQRVLENTQVYRHRLSGQPEQIRLEADLSRGH